MLGQSKVEEFRRNGFVNAGTFFKTSEVDELASELDRFLELGIDGVGRLERKPVVFEDIGSASEGPKTPVWRILNVWEASKVFERTMYRQEIVEAIQQLTEHDDLMVWHDQVQYKPPGYGGCTGWHQDAPAWRTLTPPTMVSAWIPMDDAEVENGCMWMVPGSFKWGDQSGFLRRHENLADLEEFSHLDGFIPPEGSNEVAVKPVPLPVKRGEIAFHHALNWHGSPRNKSSLRRRALAIHYMTGDTVFVESGAHMLKSFIHIPDGAPMSEAGSKFPAVCSGGKIQPPPS